MTFPILVCRPASPKLVPLFGASSDLNVLRGVYYNF